MKRINCLVQEHQFSKEDIRNIEEGFREIYHDHYSTEKLTVFWMIFPKGSAYAERKPSNGTIILIEVDEDITKDKREELMRLYSNFLLKNYKVSPLDTVITVANSSWVDSFFAAQQKRIHPMYRPWIQVKTLFTALTSKWMNGFLRLRVKY
ncbi:MAG: hypothetical protein AAF824_21135 [Bacteroidota bacterium]